MGCALPLRLALVMYEQSKALAEARLLFWGRPPSATQLVLTIWTKPHVGLILVMWKGPHLDCGLELSASAWRPRQQCCLAPARSSSLKRAICLAVQTLNEARGDVRGIAAIAGESCFGDHVGFLGKRSRVAHVRFLRMGEGMGGRQRSSSFGDGVVLELPRGVGESNSRIEMLENVHAILALLGQAPEGAAPLEPACLDQNRAQACVVS